MTSSRRRTDDHHPPQARVAAHPQPAGQHRRGGRAAGRRGHRPDRHRMARDLPGGDAHGDGAAGRAGPGDPDRPGRALLAVQLQPHRLLHPVPAAQRSHDLRGQARVGAAGLAARRAGDGGPADGGLAGARRAAGRRAQSLLPHPADVGGRDGGDLDPRADRRDPAVRGPDPDLADPVLLRRLGGQRDPAEPAGPGRPCGGVPRPLPGQPGAGLPRHGRAALGPHDGRRSAGDRALVRVRGDRGR